MKSIERTTKLFPNSKKKEFITYYNSNKKVMLPDEYIEKEEELRGVWVSTVENIDINQTTDPENLKKQLDDIVKTCKEYHLNTIVYQVRPTNDALYKSKLNPYSRYLTGTEGKDPGFDTLEYLINIGKKENIKIHAWINPYRVSVKKLSDLKQTKEEYLNSLDKKNWARKNPDCVIETSLTKLILDPASKKVRKYLCDTVMEIAKNYDVKAIHIDDYFYPYEPISDPNEEEKLKNSKFEKLSDFRRDNVNQLIKKISLSLKKLDKKVEFGISPFGIYRTKDKYFEDKTSESAWKYGSDNHHGCFSSYAGLYADVYLWMKKKWIDYVVPQVYFDMSNTKLNEEGNEYCRVRYADLVKWWSYVAAHTNIKLYIGQAIYRYSNEGDWANPEEIPNQLKYNQNYDNVLGTIFFTYTDFVDMKRNSLIEGRKILKTLWTKDVEEI